MSLPQELIEQLEKGNVILFCGAGISASEGGLPSGQQLARELAERAGVPALFNAPLPEVAQAYELEMGHHSLIEYIAGRINDSRYIPLRTHRLIAALPFSKIITTNWDNLLEEALHQAGKLVVKAVRDSNLAYVDDAKVLLIKLHGSIEQQDSIVITGDDYYDVFVRLPETANFVRAYFATKTILFLGFGLADEDFKRLYHEVVRHIGVHKRRAYAVQLSPDELMVKYWGQKNVKIITADAMTFLQALAEALGKDIPVAPSSEPTLSRLYAGATQAEANQDWQQAIALLRQVLAIDGKYKDASQKLAEAERQERLRSLYTEADQAYAKRDWTRAIELLQQVLAIDGKYKDASQKLAEAERQGRLQSLYTEAEQAYARKEWTRTIELLQQVLTIDGKYKDASQKLAEAERQGRLQSLYTEAEQAYARKEWARTIELLQQVLAIDGKYKDALQRLDQAIRQRRLEQLRARVKQATPFIIAIMALAVIVMGTWRYWTDINAFLLHLMPAAMPSSAWTPTPGEEAVKEFLITKEGRPTVTVKPGTTITATVDEIVPIKVEASTAYQEQQKTLSFTWYSCRAGSSPVLRRIGNPEMLYVAPSEPGPDCIRVVVEKGGMPLDTEKIFVDVQR